MRVLRADLTRPDATLDAYLRSFGGAGLPFAVVLLLLGISLLRG